MNSRRIWFAFLLVLTVTSAAAAATKPKAAPKEMIVTGEHRGYTNDRLFLKLDNEKEMTFLVRIPGDTDAKWHDAFETTSRISVTYHNEPGQKFPIATAIKSAPKQ